MSLAAKLALSPLLVAQALRTRRRLPRLPEAEGERDGVAEGPAAAGASQPLRTLRLLIAGDSSAAGVGVPHQRDALAQPLALHLARMLGVTVRWHLTAQAGLGTAHLLERLAASDGPQADLAVVVSGVNDVIEQVPSQRAVRHREALANLLRNRLGVLHVVFAQLPPLHHFPGLPQPLRWVAGADARRHDRALAHWVASRRDVSRAEIDMVFNRALMAPDGIHPGVRGYRAIAHAIAHHVESRVWPLVEGRMTGRAGTHAAPPDARRTQEARRPD